MSSSRHRAFRRRSVLTTLALALAGSLFLTLSSPGGPPPAEAAAPVSKSICKRFDPNLVNGVCLKYQGKSGTGYTWIGSYRATNGKVFFCIDYLYDSRISGNAATVDTQPLVNQLGKTVGDAEVAALNYVISTWAPAGATGDDTNDAAIALIIREVMSDATRPDGTVVYKPGLKVGGTVAAPIGGLTGGVIDTARAMWRKASLYRGPGRVVLAGPKDSELELGASQDYRVAVFSASDHLVPGLKVTFTCTGPVTCPKPVITKETAVTVPVTPSALGTATIKATASAPAADGQLLKLTTWRTHAGKTASDSGVQRGWIAIRTTSAASATATAVIVKGTPEVTTRASSASAVAGAGLRDVVTVSGLPAGTTQTVTASLYGPFPAQPGAESCTENVKVGQVTFPIAADGDVTTPPVTVDEPGYYVWTEALPGDDLTNPVTTPCGVVTETTTVTRTTPKAATPRVSTTASAEHLLVGQNVHDTVRVDGLTGDAEVLVGWTLHGPLAPHNGSCVGLDWTRASVLAKGSFRADHNGSYRTTATRLANPGCVTFSELLPASGGNAAVSTKPGEVSETLLVTRRAVPVVPEIPSGR